MMKPVSLAIASLAGAALVASCSSSKKTEGSSSPPASSSATTTLSSAELRQEVGAAMQAARLFHLRGNATDDAGKPIKFDIHFGPHRAAGSITQSGSELDLINPGGASVYFKAPDSVWKQQGGDAAVALFHDRWVKVPANDKRFAELVTSFAKESFIAELTSDDSDAGDLRKIGDATVDGMPAVEYESSDHTHIYVAASGSPVLLKIVKSGSDSGTITFSDYNKPYPFQPPPAEQTIDFAKLEQR